MLWLHGMAWELVHSLASDACASPDESEAKTDWSSLGRDAARAVSLLESERERYETKPIKSMSNDSLSDTILNIEYKQSDFRVRVTKARVWPTVSLILRSVYAL